MQVRIISYFIRLILISFLFVTANINTILSQNIGLSIVSLYDRGCAPLEICFKNTSDSTGFDRFEWDFNNDGIADETYGPENAGQTVCHTFNNKPFQDRVFLVGVRTDGSKDGAFVSVFVYHPNNASIGALPSLVCSGSVSLTNNSIINDDGSLSLTIWDFGDGSPIEITNQATVSHEFIAEGNLTVTMTDSNLCGTSSTTSNIEVSLLNTAIQSSLDSQVCQGELIEFTNSDHRSELIYSWDFGDGSQNTSSSSPTYKYLTSGTYNVELQVNIPDGIGCNDTDSFEIEVKPGPIAEFVFGFQPGCDSLEVDFTDKSTEVQIGDEYFWDFGNGMTSTDKTIASKIYYDSAGYYYPELTLSRNSNSCSSTYTDTILVPSTPVAAFSADNVCMGQNAFFTDESTSEINPVTSWNWDFGGLSSSSDRNPTTTFNTSGNLLVNLTISTGYCSNSFSKTIRVEDLPHPGFIPSISSGCSPLSVSFTNNTPDAESYQWKFGDQKTDTLTSPVNIFTNNTNKDTTYHTKLIAKTAFGCKDSVTTAITVFSAPMASFSSDASSIPSCGPDTITFINSSSGADSIHWIFGDNTEGSDSIETHIFENHDYYFKHFEVKLITMTSNGCKDTSRTQYVSLYPKPRTDFTIDTSKICHPAQVNMYAPIETEATYSWNFSNSNTLTTQNFNVTQSFSNHSSEDTTYMIKLATTSQFNCIDSIEKPLVIHPKPRADYTFSPNPANHPATISFINYSDYNPNWNYTWTFENENNDSITSYDIDPIQFNDPVDIPVKLVITTDHQCLDTLTDTIKIIPPPPVLDYTIDTLQGCPPLKVTFKNISIYTDTTTYLWDFGDGTYSTEVNPVHTYYDHGEITISLTASGIDKSIVNKDTTIDVFEKPSSAFSALPDEVYIPDQAVHYSPRYPVEGEFYYWDFGDNQTSRKPEPQHFYQDTGHFTVTLIVISEKGCADTLDKMIHAKISGNVIAPNVFFPGTDSDGGGTGGGNGGGIVSPDDLDNSVFAPMTEGVAEYHLEIYNRWGEKLFASDSKELGWSGYYQGKLCKEDVYVWKVFGKYSTGQTFIKAGTLTLLHK